jgi:hypothetical protein
LSARRIEGRSLGGYWYISILFMKDERSIQKKGKMQARPMREASAVIM